MSCLCLILHNNRINLVYYYRNALMYIPWSKSHYTSMKSNISMTLTLYMSYKKLIRTIQFGLLKSSKIILFKDLVEK